MRKLRSNLLNYEPILLVSVLWLVFFIDAVSSLDLNNYGIQPRNLMALPGILFSPFLHGNMLHLISNSIPLFIFSVLLRLHGRQVFLSVTLFIILFCGMFVWAFSPNGIVIGASGLVFGYWSFLITHGFLHRSWKSLIISILVLLFYGSMVFSFFYTHPNISWTAHFAGALGGFLAARYFRVIFPRRRSNIR